MFNAPSSFKETEIGPIPEEWGVVSVFDVAGINQKTLSVKSDLAQIRYLDTSSVESGVIVDFQNLSINDAPSRAKRILRDNDIVISTVRPNLKHFAFIKKAEDNWIGSTGFAVLTPKEIDPLFLYYSITTDSVTEYLSSVAASQTSTYPAINPDVIENLVIALPSKNEQIFIAEILSSLDDKIELNRQINANLEKIANALFKRWFVDFEFPDENGKPYKSSGGKMVESELGEIPEGWRVGVLKDVLELSYGKALKAENRTDGLIQVYGSSGFVGFHDEKLVTGPGIIVGRKGNVGSVFWSDEDFYPIDTTYFVKSKMPLIYCYYLLKNQTFVNGDSVVPGLSRDQAYRIEVVLPNDYLLKQFEKIVMDIRNMIFSTDQQIEKLVSIRDSLLPRLMSGKIRVV